MKQQAVAVWLFFVVRFFFYIRITETNTKVGFYRRELWKRARSIRIPRFSEVREETGVAASIIKYVGKSEYSFSIPEDTVEKDVHWYLMMSDSYYSKPQREEYFVDSGYYKYHEAYHLLKFANEKQILEKAYNEYLDLKKSNLWGNKKYF